MMKKIEDWPGYLYWYWFGEVGNEPVDEDEDQIDALGFIQPEN